MTNRPGEAESGTTGMRIGVSAMGADPETVDFVVEAERLGADSVWVAEMWGHDALTPLAYLAARTTRIRLATGIAQLGARSPALLAMSAMSMQSISGGRFVLGLGTSGPQVMEGWHGVRFDAPIALTRETIAIVRQIARGDRLVHEGRVYQLPLPDSAGRALRTMAAPVEVPVYVASLGPRNLELTGQLADGWLASCFMPETADAFVDPIRVGAERAGRARGDIDLVVPAAVEITDDEEAAARRHADGYAFTMGAMGSRDRNFYNDAFTRQGFGDDVRAVQELWLDGRREEAAARVPIEIGRRTSLLGPPEVIRERLRRHQAAGVTAIQARLSGPLDRRLETLATLIDLSRDLDRPEVGP